VARLALDAARGSGLGVQAFEADAGAAVDADAVAAVGETLARGFDLAQLGHVARQLRLVKIGEQRRDRLVADVVRRPGKLAELLSRARAASRRSSSMRVSRRRSSARRNWSFCQGFICAS